MNRNTFNKFIAIFYEIYKIMEFFLIRIYYFIERLDTIYVKATSFFEFLLVFIISILMIKGTVIIYKKLSTYTNNQQIMMQKLCNTIAENEDISAEKINNIIDYKRPD